MNTITLNHNHIKKHLRQFLKKWKHPVPLAPDETFKVLLSISVEKNDCDHIEQTRELIEKWVDKLQKISPENATLVKLRYFTGKSIQMLANQFNYSTHQINRHIKQSVEEISNIGIRYFEKKYSSWFNLQTGKIPFSESSDLVGLTEHLAQLEQVLAPNSPHNVLLITGIGGIGKSTLSSALTRRLLAQPNYHLFTWINADRISSKITPTEVNFDQIVDHLKDDFLNHENDSSALKLRDHIASHPCLIVIDGINELSSYEQLLDKIRQFPKTAKFIITSRRRHISNDHIYQFPLGELSKPDTADLITTHSRNIGLEEQTDFLAANFEKIYDRIGGNPLAIKLMIGLLHAYPLPTILEDLQKMKIKNTERMYKYIYWQAWNSLDTNAKKLLAAMPLISQDGSEISFLISITRLEDRQMLEALKSLLNRSLIEYHQTPEKHRYGIHHLTRSFLQTEIVKWPQNN